MILILFIVFAAIGWATDYRVGCYNQSPPGQRQIYPTKFVDCAEPIKNLVKYDKAHAPTLFSRKRGLGYKLPAQWVSRSCAIFLDARSDDDEDYATFYDIAIEAGVINAACVANPPHLGGTNRVGPKKIMNISIFGLRQRGPFLPITNLSAISDDIA